MISFEHTLFGVYPVLVYITDEGMIDKVITDDNCGDELDLRYVRFCVNIALPGGGQVVKDNAGLGTYLSTEIKKCLRDHDNEIKARRAEAPKKLKEDTAWKA